MYRYNIREPDWISADNLAFFVCSLHFLTPFWTKGILRSFFFTGENSGMTGNLCTTILVSNPGISSFDQAKTS